MEKELVYLPIAYIIFFILVIFFAILTNGLLVKFSGNLGTRSNTNNQIRWNSSQKPSFGGISFFIIFLLSLSALSFVFENSNVFHNVKLLGIVGATSIGFLMGLFDDAFNTNVVLKFLTQISCGLILIATGTYVTVFNSDILNYFVTVLWVVGMMNSINMLDNMDGISTIASISILLTIFIDNILLSGLQDNINMLMLGVIAGLIGFLIYNWPPSKMFMGDTGSQFLGVILASFSIVFLWNHPQEDHVIVSSKNIVSVLVIFAVPLIDTATVSIKRIIRGRSPFIGGKDHTTHHLSYLGLSDKKVAFVFVILSLISMVLGLLSLSITQWNHLYTILFSAYFMVIFIILFYISNLNKQKS